MSATARKFPPRMWKWRFEALAHSAIERILGRLPAATVHRLGGAVGLLAWHILTRRRRLVRRNLRIAFAGEMEPAAIERLARDSFIRSGANLFGATRTARMSIARLARCVQIENLELLAEATANRSGAIVLISHMGNWELIARVNQLVPKGLSMGALYRPLNNPVLDERIARRRGADGTRLFSKRDSFHQISTFVRGGAAVGILADQRVGNAGSPGRFFGRATRLTPLPCLLARRSRAAMLAVSLRTTSPGRWALRFHAVENASSVQSSMDALEAAMRISPVDVFWLQDRWKCPVSPHQTIRDWLGEADSFPSRPHRALIWHPEGSGEWQLPTAWKHPDVHYEHVFAKDIGAPPAGFLRDSDDSGPLPIDFILLAGTDPVCASAAKRLQIPCVLVTSAAPSIRR